MTNNKYVLDDVVRYISTHLTSNSYRLQEPLRSFPLTSRSLKEKEYKDKVWLKKNYYSII